LDDTITYSICPFFIQSKDVIIESQLPDTEVLLVISYLSDYPFRTLCPELISENGLRAIATSIGTTPTGDNGGKREGATVWRMGLIPSPG
jgi:hypothetical protein